MAGLWDVLTKSRSQRAAARSAASKKVVKAPVKKKRKVAGGGGFQGLRRAAAPAINAKRGRQAQIDGYLDQIK